MLQKFLEETVLEVEKKMGDCYQVKTEHVLKNNGVELDSILILREGENISPSIYVNDFYEEYKAGKAIELIAREVIAGYHQCMARKDTFIPELDVSLANFRSKIFYRLVNFKENAKMMQNVPYIPFLDLAITFYCLVEKREGAIGTLQITNHLMKEWKIGKAELFRLATENTPKLFPLQIRTMDAIVGEMLQRDMEELTDHYRRSGVPEEALEDARNCCKIIMESLEKSREIPIYVMSNTSGINGAAAMLYENVMEEFAASHQSDFYVLPSSIHEILLIPCACRFSAEELKTMVCEVNDTQVPEEDILSGEVYIFRKDGNYFEWKGMENKENMTKK